MTLCLPLFGNLTSCRRYYTTMTSSTDTVECLTLLTEPGQTRSIWLGCVHLASLHSLSHQMKSCLCYICMDPSVAKADLKRGS